MGGNKKEWSSTYPVMFVMKFDSILLVDVSKRCTLWMHSFSVSRRSHRDTKRQGRAQKRKKYPIKANIRFALYSLVFSSWFSLYRFASDWKFFVNLYFFTRSVFISATPLFVWPFFFSLPPLRHNLLVLMLARVVCISNHNRLQWFFFLLYLQSSVCVFFILSSQSEKENSF